MCAASPDHFKRHGREHGRRMRTPRDTSAVGSDDGDLSNYKNSQQREKWFLKSTADATLESRGPMSSLSSEYGSQTSISFFNESSPKTNAKLPSYGTRNTSHMTPENINRPTSLSHDRPPSRTDTKESLQHLQECEEPAPPPQHTDELGGGGGGHRHAPGNRTPERQGTSGVQTGGETGTVEMEDAKTSQASLAAASRPPLIENVMSQTAPPLTGKEEDRPMVEVYGFLEVLSVQNEDPSWLTRAGLVPKSTPNDSAQPEKVPVKAAPTPSDPQHVQRKTYPPPGLRRHVSTSGQDNVTLSKSPPAASERHRYYGEGSPTAKGAKSFDLRAAARPPAHRSADLSALQKSSNSPEQRTSVLSKAALRAQVSDDTNNEQPSRDQQADTVRSSPNVLTKKAPPATKEGETAHTKTSPVQKQPRMKATNRIGPETDRLQDTSDVQRPVVKTKQEAKQSPVIASHTAPSHDTAARPSNKAPLLTKRPPPKQALKANDPLQKQPETGLAKKQPLQPPASSQRPEKPDGPTAKGSHSFETRRSNALNDIPSKKPSIQAETPMQSRSFAEAARVLPKSPKTVVALATTAKSEKDVGSPQHISKHEATTTPENGPSELDRNSPKKAVSKHSIKPARNALPPKRTTTSPLKSTTPQKERDANVSTSTSLPKHALMPQDQPKASSGPVQNTLHHPTKPVPLEQDTLLDDKKMPVEESRPLKNMGSLRQHKESSTKAIKAAKTPPKHRNDIPTTHSKNIVERRETPASASALSQKTPTGPKPLRLPPKKTHPSPQPQTPSATPAVPTHSGLQKKESNTSTSDSRVTPLKVLTSVQQRPDVTHRETSSTQGSVTSLKASGVHKETPSLKTNETQPPVSSKTGVSSAISRTQPVDTMASPAALQQSTSEETSPSMKCPPPQNDDDKVTRDHAPRQDDTRPAPKHPRELTASRGDRTQERNDTNTTTLSQHDRATRPALPPLPTQSTEKLETVKKGSLPKTSARRGGLSRFVRDISTKVTAAVEGAFHSSTNKTPAARHDAQHVPVSDTHELASPPIALPALSSTVPREEEPVVSPTTDPRRGAEPNVVDSVLQPPSNADLAADEVVSSQDLPDEKSAGEAEACGRQHKERPQTPFDLPPEDPQHDAQEADVQHASQQTETDLQGERTPLASFTTKDEEQEKATCRDSQPHDTSNKAESVERRSEDEKQQEPGDVDVSTTALRAQPVLEKVGRPSSEQTVHKNHAPTTLTCLPAVVDQSDSPLTEPRDNSESVDQRPQEAQVTSAVSDATREKDSNVPQSDAGILNDVATRHDTNAAAESLEKRHLPVQQASQHEHNARSRPASPTAVASANALLCRQEESANAPGVTRDLQHSPPLDSRVPCEETLEDPLTKAPPSSFPSQGSVSSKTSSRPSLTKDSPVLQSTRSDDVHTRVVSGSSALHRVVRSAQMTPVPQKVSKTTSASLLIEQRRGRLLTKRLTRTPTLSSQRTTPLHPNGSKRTPKRSSSIAVKPVRVPSQKRSTVAAEPLIDDRRRPGRVVVALATPKAAETTATAASPVVTPPKTKQHVPRQSSRHDSVVPKKHPVRMASSQRMPTSDDGPKDTTKRVAQGARHAKKAAPAKAAKSTTGSGNALKRSSVTAPLQKKPRQASQGDVSTDAGSRNGSVDVSPPRDPASSGTPKTPSSLLPKKKGAIHSENATPSAARPNAASGRPNTDPTSLPTPSRQVAFRGRPLPSSSVPSEPHRLSRETPPKKETQQHVAKVDGTPVKAKKKTSPEAKPTGITAAAAAAAQTTGMKPHSHPSSLPESSGQQVTIGSKAHPPLKKKKKRLKKADDERPSSSSASHTPEPSPSSHLSPSDKDSENVPKKQRPLSAAQRAVQRAMSSEHHMEMQQDNDDGHRDDDSSRSSSVFRRQTKDDDQGGGPPARLSSTTRQDPLPSLRREMPPQRPPEPRSTKATTASAAAAPSRLTQRKASSLLGRRGSYDGNGQEQRPNEEIQHEKKPPPPPPPQRKEPLRPTAHRSFEEKPPLYMRTTPAPPSASHDEFRRQQARKGASMLPVLPIGAALRDTTVAADVRPTTTRFLGKGSADVGGGRAAAKGSKKPLPPRPSKMTLKRPMTARRVVVTPSQSVVASPVPPSDLSTSDASGGGVDRQLSSRQRYGSIEEPFPTMEGMRQGTLGRHRPVSTDPHGEEEEVARQTTSPTIALKYDSKESASKGRRRFHPPGQTDEHGDALSSEHKTTRRHHDHSDASSSSSLSSHRPAQQQSESVGGQNDRVSRSQQPDQNNRSSAAAAAATTLGSHTSGVREVAVGPDHRTYGQLIGPVMLFQTEESNDNVPGRRAAAAVPSLDYKTEFFRAPYNGRDAGNISVCFGFPSHRVQELTSVRPRENGAAAVSWYTSQDARVPPQPPHPYGQPAAYGGGGGGGGGGSLNETQGVHIGRLELPNKGSRAGRLLPAPCAKKTTFPTDGDPSGTSFRYDADRRHAGGATMTRHDGPSVSRQNEDHHTTKRCCGLFPPTVLLEGRQEQQQRSPWEVQRPFCGNSWCTTTPLCSRMTSTEDQKNSNSLLAPSSLPKTTTTTDHHPTTITYVTRGPLIVHAHPEYEAPAPIVEEARKLDAHHGQGNAHAQWYLNMQRKKLDAARRLEDIQNHARWRVASVPPFLQEHSKTLTTPLRQE